MKTVTPRVLKQARCPSPELSVIVPVFNAAPFVRETLSSILAQNGLRFEVLAIDDGSTDDSLNELMASDDDRLTVMAVPGNVGPSVARNTAVMGSRAPWLCPFDADDIMCADVLAPYFRFVTGQPQAFWGYCRLVAMDAQRRPLWEMRNRFDLVRFLQHHTVVHGMSLIRREQFLRAGGYEDELRTAEDYDLFLRLVQFGDPVFYDHTGFHYRQHDTNISRTCGNRQRVHERFAVNLQTPDMFPECGPRRDILRECLRAIAANAASRWPEVIQHGTFLLQHGVRGFETYHLLVVALQATNEPRKALNLVFECLQAMQDRSFAGSYQETEEIRWCVEQGQILAGLCGDAAALRILSTVAATMPQKPHPTYTAFVTAITSRRSPTL